MTTGTRTRKNNLVQTNFYQSPISNTALPFIPIAAIIFSVFSSLIALAAPGARDFALIPITVGGFLIGSELLRAIIFRIDFFSPRSIMAIFGVYFLYVVPILHMSMDHWLRYIPTPVDWRGDLGKFATFQAFGILAYLFLVPLRKRFPSPRILNQKAYNNWAVLFIGFGMLAWIIVAMRFGGPAGYIKSLIDETADLTGFGSILIFAESWPSLMLAVLLVRFREKFQHKPGALIILFLLFLVLQFLVGGLRGSRALTVWPFIIALVVCHLIVRRIRLKAIVWIGLSLFTFSWIYSIYKSAGSDVIKIFNGTQSSNDLVNETGRDIETLLTEDFGRTGVQTLTWGHLENGFMPKWGETYIGDIFKFLPDSLNLFEFRDKTPIATEMFYGLPSESLAGFQSSRILGLTGEAMVNFGFLGIPLSFMMLAWVVSKADQIYKLAKANSEAIGTCLIAATLPSVCVLFLISDLDNLILFYLKYALPIAGVAWISSMKSTNRIQDLTRL